MDEGSPVSVSVRPSVRPAGRAVVGEVKATGEGGPILRGLELMGDSPLPAEGGQ